MFHGTFALMNQSLRMQSRNMRAHGFRIGAILLIYFAVVRAFSVSAIVGAPGLEFLMSMAYLNLVMITLAGPSAFATLITEERAERMLGLLTLAGVNSLSMIAGRLAPQLFASVLLLTVQFPFTLLAITLGGVTWHQVVAIYMALLAWLILAANLGLFFSAISKRSGSAAAATTLVLLAMLFVPLLVTSTTRPTGAPPPPPVIEWLGNLSMFGRITQITRTGFADSAFSVQVLSHLGIALGCFVASLAVLSHSLGTASDLEAAPARAVVRGSRRFLGPGRAWARAIPWKDFHFLAGGTRWLVVKFIVYPLLVGGLAVLFSDAVMFDSSAMMLFTPIMVCLLLLEASLHASRVFRTEVQDKTFSTLALLPQWTGSIMYSKIAGCAIGLLPAVFWSVVGLPMWLQSVSGGYALFYVGLALSYGVFFCYLVAWLSLVVRYGALPLAFAITWLTSCAFPLCLVGIFILDAKIHERLEHAAAE